MIFYVITSKPHSFLLFSVGISAVGFSISCLILFAFALRFYAGEGRVHLRRNNTNVPLGCPPSYLTRKPFDPFKRSRSEIFYRTSQRHPSCSWRHQEILLLKEHIFFSACNS